ncbi:MAG: hypothetical protein H7Y28_15275 [Rhodoferax sp.]|nr:hypothetical protein [Rhodoferax sp.]
MHRQRLASILLALVTVAYPLLVYLGLGHFEPRWFAVLLVAIGLIRLVAKPSPATWGLVAAALLLAGVAWWSNAWLALKLYPVGVNLLLAALFGASLFYPPTVVERIARLREPNLPVEGVAYTRSVTKVWLAFFIFNGALALATALWASDALWTLYNGLIAYCLIGILGGAEWLVRRRVRRSYGAAAKTAEMVVHG